MTKHTRKLTALLLLAVLILSACSSSDEKNESEFLPGTDASQTDTVETGKDETTADTSADTGTNLPPELTEVPYAVVQNPGNLTISTVSIDADEHLEFRYDDRYVIVISFNIIRDKGGNPLEEPDNLRLRVLDTSSGTFTTDMHFAGTDIPRGISHFYGGCWLYGSSSAWKAVITDGKIAIEPVRLVQVELNGRAYFSPDGKWRANDIQRTDPMPTQDQQNAGGIWLKNTADGSGEKILANVNGNTEEFRTYSVMGFLDGTRLAYSVTGWDGAIGWGIYDVQKKSHVTGQGTVCGIRDGALYLNDGADPMLPDTLKKVTADGTVTVLAEKNTAQLPLFPGTDTLFYRTYTMQAGLWIITPYESDGELGTYTRTYVFSADAKTLLAEILVGPDGGSDFWYTDGKTLTLVKP